MTKKATPRPAGRGAKKGQKSATPRGGRATVRSLTGPERYARRIANREAKLRAEGVPESQIHQRARGHKPGEARRRRERERAVAEYRLTSDQRYEVRKFAREQWKRMPSAANLRDPAKAVAKALFEWIERNGVKEGYRAFIELRDRRNRLKRAPRERHRTKITRRRDDGGGSGGGGVGGGGGAVLEVQMVTVGPSEGPSSMGQLTDWADELDLPEEFGEELLYYH